jgi:peptidoglycan-N-acetylglucosamine deacetylase
MADCPVVLTVNVDVESHDEKEAGGAGLFGRFSYGRYSIREGLWRLLDVFDAQGVPATFFVSSADAARHPEIVEAILNRAHEVAALGRSFEDHSRLGDEEPDVLRQTRDSLARITGNAPLGWRSPTGLLSTRTLPELAELGFVYESSFEDDDVPYVWESAAGKRLVELPVFAYLGDSIFYLNRHSHDRVRKVWLEEINAMYAARCYINLTVHTRGDIGSGRAVRAQVVAEVIGALGRLPGVAFQRCGDVARQWKESARATERFPE